MNVYSPTQNSPPSLKNGGRVTLVESLQHAVIVEKRTRPKTLSCFLEATLGRPRGGAALSVPLKSLYTGTLGSLWDSQPLNFDGKLESVVPNVHVTFRRSEEQRRLLRLSNHFACCGTTMARNEAFHPETREKGSAATLQQPHLHLLVVKTEAAPTRCVAHATCSAIPCLLSGEGTCVGRST